MAHAGRKPDAAHRTKSGQKSRSAKIDADDGLVASQPHRRVFGELLGPQVARAHLAETALGRLRLIGIAEDRMSIAAVQAKLFPLRPQRGLSNGLGEDEYLGAQAYAAAVGRERWVRAAPKDKPAAISFMIARGIDLSARDLSDNEARRYTAQFEEARAVLAAATCSLDMQRVLRQLRAKVENVMRGPMVAEMTEVLRLMRGLGTLASPANSARIKRAVDTIVIDDRDPTAEELMLARPGLRALAEWEGAARARQKAARTRHSGERPTQSTPDGWKDRHRSLAGGAG